MKCQKCGTQNINEAVRCSNCGVKLDVVSVEVNLETKSNQSRVMGGLKVFIHHLIRPKGLKLWIIIICTLIFLLPAVIGTFFAYIARPYLIEKGKEEIQAKQEQQHNTEDIERDFNLIKKNKAKANVLKDAIAQYYDAKDKYPIYIKDLKLGNDSEFENFSLVDSNYLVGNIQGSKKMQMVMVPFLNQQKKLAWDCYVLGFDSALGDTGCIEVNDPSEIPRIDQVIQNKVKR